MPVFDIETDGFNATKIHVLSWEDDQGNVRHTHDYDTMRNFFEESKMLIGHYIVGFDLKQVYKILGIKVKARRVDTLAISWYLNHHRSKHGLESYGEDYGVPKPVITDWDSLTPQEYAHRCDEDVRINSRLWRELDSKLNKLYPNEADKWRLIDYLTFKMDCIAEQEDLQWKLDVEKAKGHLEEWEKLKDKKVEQLAEAMPPIKNYSMRSRPKVWLKKDGSLSSKAQDWVELCREHMMPDTTQTLSVYTGQDRGNPNSPQQVKDWLYSLGWEPTTWKYTRNKVTGDEKKVEQVRKDGELCESVRRLSSKDKAVDILDGLSVLSHRIAVLKGMVKHESDGYVQATVAGFTNTMRFRHATPLVNLPSVDKPYGKEIRGCLTCPDGMILCGADMVSLEDTTKRHYMKPLDPDYVEEMSKEGFDPHLDLAKHSGVVTQEDIDKHNSGERSLKELRKNYKVVNYSATYGVGAPKLARETGMSVKEAKSLLDAFWSRNWSVQRVAEGLSTKELFGGMWLYNPVSGFWYSLRSEKDRFSTLNQSTGVYCFDSWVALCRKEGIKVIGQFHDEIIALIKSGEEEETYKLMKDCISKLNTKLKLNVDLDVSPQFGKTYADIH
jgi:DNA polymerase I-like protein with 3'-5' exonuclease and polymerase domains